MQVALKDKNIFYAIENWNQDNDSIWGPLTGNSWRSSSKTGTGPLNLSKFRTVFYYSLNNPSSQSGVGAWADLGSMQIVNNVNLSPNQKQTYFAIYCFAKSQLMISNNFTEMNPEVLSIITNKALIALNQDSAGYQLQCVMNCQMPDSVEVFKV